MTFIESSRPDVVMLHAFWNPPLDIAKLRGTVEALKAVPVRRIVLLGRTPVWDKRGLKQTALNYYRFRGELIPERIPAQPDDAATDHLMASIAGQLGIEFISARNPFCNPDGCLTRLGPSVLDLVATDQIHLTAKGSQFLIGAISAELFPGMARRTPGPDGGEPPQR